MIRPLLLSLIAILTMSTLTHAKIVTQRIEYKHGDTVLEGVLAYDDAAKEKRPGVLVCHEWWGMNAYAEKRATMLAELGYVAFALDMFGKGKTTEDAKQAGAWAGEVFKDNANLRERAALGLKQLAESDKVDPTRLAAIGYCMGGTVALELARSDKPHTADLKAVVAFHASTVSAAKADDNANIKGTVLICHGAADNFVKPEELPAFEKQMADAKVDYMLVSYAGAKHAFTNPNADKHTDLGVAYQKTADERSWGHMQSLFQSTLASK